MSEATDEALLIRIKKLLAGGLETQTAPIPEDNFQLDAIIAELRDLPADAVEKKLVISGYMDHPYEVEYRCFECMYFRPHRGWCTLPEIDLPAEPDWWCRLWRI